jgi:H+/Cl- antiporter ClcA
MRKHAALLVLTFLVLAAFAGYASWAVVHTAQLGGGWRDLLPIWPYVAGGAVGVALLTGLLMWLAFHSANRGYDDRSRSEED